MYGFCIYEEFYNYIYGKRVYVSKTLIRQYGRREWYDLLHEFVGAFVIDKRRGIAIDLFPWIFTEEEVAEQDQLEKILDTYRQARREKRIARDYINDTGG